MSIPSILRDNNVAILNAVTKLVDGAAATYVDAGALRYFGIQSVPNPTDPARPDVYTVDEPTFVALINKLVLSQLINLKLLNADGTPLATTGATPATSAPTISGFSPSSGVAGSTEKIFGTNFTGATLVSLNSGAVQSFTVDSPTQITAILTSSNTTGLWRVTTPQGTATSLDQFKVTLPAGIMPVVLLLGQSNTVGVNDQAETTVSPLSDVSPGLALVHDRVDILNPNTGTMDKLQLGVNNIGTYMGSEIGLAHRWEKENTTARLGIIKQGHAGQAIEKWAKRTDSSQPVTYYDELRDAYINPAKAYYANQGLTMQVVALVWKQGESNQGDTAYASKLQAFVDNLTSDGLISSSTKLVISEIKSDATVAAQDAAFVNQNGSRAVLVKTANYVTGGDNLHYTARTQYLAGYVDEYNGSFGTVSAYPFPFTGTAATVSSGGTSTTTTSGVEETDSNLKYVGDWQVGANTGYSAGKNKFLPNADGFYGFSFTGNAFALDYLTLAAYPVSQEVWVMKDGGTRELHQVIGTTTDTALGEQYGLSGLANGLYHVQVVCRNTNSAFGWADRVRVNGNFQAYSGPLDVPAVTYVAAVGRTDDVAWTYTGNWSQNSSNDVNYKGANHTTTNAGDSCTIQFQGTDFTLKNGHINGYRTWFDVYVDGALDGTFDEPASNDTERFEQNADNPNGTYNHNPYVSQVYGNGIHTIKVVSKGVCIMDVLDVRVTQAATGKALASADVAQQMNGTYESGALHAVDTSKAWSIVTNKNLASNTNGFLQWTVGATTPGAMVTANAITGIPNGDGEYGNNHGLKKDYNGTIVVTDGVGQTFTSIIPREGDILRNTFSGSDVISSLSSDKGVTFTNFATSKRHVDANGASTSLNLCFYGQGSTVVKDVIYAGFQ